jgi:hypothetical protein
MNSQNLLFLYELIMNDLKIKLKKQFCLPFHQNCKILNLIKKAKELYTENCRRIVKNLKKTKINGNLLLVHRHCNLK